MGRSTAAWAEGGSECDASCLSANGVTWQCRWEGAVHEAAIGVNAKLSWRTHAESWPCIAANGFFLERSDHGRQACKTMCLLAIPLCSHERPSGCTCGFHAAARRLERALTLLEQFGLANP